MAENEVIEWIPSITDDYAVGKVTFTAGSKDITFKDAFNGAEKSYTAGDSIYIPTEGRWLLLKEITSTTKGTLLYPCPESCAGTFDLRIRPLSRNARQAGLATMTLRNLNSGNLPGLANAKLKTGQILVASQIAGSFDAIDLNADNVAETETRKFMPPTIPAEIVEETDNRKIMTAEERAKIAGINGLGQNDWNDGISSTEALISPEKLIGAIKNSFGGNLDNGWAKLPNGLILQWGKLRNLNGGVAFAFPVRFPNKTGAFIAQIRTDWVSDQHFPLVYASWADDLGGAIVWCHDLKNGNVEVLYSADVDWIAIGF